MAFDPEKHALGKLFWFWHAYDREDELLQVWHDSTARVSKPTGNVLFDSFLDTWGKGDWQEVKDDSVPFEKRSYFQALGVVSNQLSEQCRRNVLDRFLVPQGDKFKLPPELKPGVDPTEAERLAQDEIAKLLAAFNHAEIPSLKNIDKRVKEERDNSPDNRYLNALLRMMLIETRCFEIQKKFLEEGKILPESA
jgi:hypothetical protein